MRSFEGNRCSKGLLSSADPLRQRHKGTSAQRNGQKAAERSLAEKSVRRLTAAGMAQVCPEPTLDEILAEPIV